MQKRLAVGFIDSIITLDARRFLAMEMLSEISPLLPDSTTVFVMNDSWYSSHKLIKFCLKNKWDLICALKSNRLLDGRRLSRLARYSRNKSFYPVWIGSAANSTKYLSRTFLSLAYLYWRRGNMQSPDEKKLADIISEHRSEHLQKALKHFGQEVLRLRSVDQALRTLFPEIV